MYSFCCTAAVQCWCWRAEEGGWWCWCRCSQTSWSWSFLNMGAKTSVEKHPRMSSWKHINLFFFWRQHSTVSHIDHSGLFSSWNEHLNAASALQTRDASDPSAAQRNTSCLNVTHDSYSLFTFTCISVVSEVILHFFILRYCVVVPPAVEHLHQGSWKIYSLSFERSICLTLCRNSTVQFSSVLKSLGLCVSLDQTAYREHGDMISQACGAHVTHPPWAPKRAVFSSL